MLGLCAFHFGTRLGITCFCLCLILGAAAALSLPALGGNSIPPAHLMLVFLCIMVCLRPDQLKTAAHTLAYPGVGFWFTAYILFSVLSAYFLPRIFEAATLVYSSARDGSAATSPLASPLRPGSANLSQAVYLLGDLACFAVIAGLARLGYNRHIAQALVMTATACFAFAIIDVVTFFSGHSYLFDPIRNASYTMHVGETFAGFKRIVGTFPEASGYGASALALLSFSLFLWLERFPIKHLGTISLIGATTIVFCTSTSAYTVAGLMFVIFVATGVWQLWRMEASRTYIAFLLLAVLVLPTLVIGLMLVPTAWDAVVGLYNEAFAQKLDSQSGEERTAWNRLAMMAFFDTSGIGAGLGSVRTSSFAAALLSNVGLPGTLLFAIFAYRFLMHTKEPITDRGNRSICRAAIMSTICQLGSAMVANGGLDLGLMFSVTLALATSSPRHDPYPRHTHFTAPRSAGPSHGNRSRIGEFA